MKILFIIPPDIHYIEPYAYKQASNHSALRPNLGLLHVASVLKKTLGISAKIIDAQVEKLSLTEIENIVVKEQPDIIGFSVLTFNILNCIEAAKKCKKASPKTAICFGGWHPTLYPTETLNLACVDYIVIGEGEITFTELVTTLRNKKNAIKEEINTIPGIGYKTSSRVIKINPPRELIKNLDDLPLPAYDLIELKKYSNILAHSDYVANIMTSRGCPYGCIFCDMRRTKFRFRTAENVLAEIKFLKSKGIKEFYIQDDNFTIDHRRAIEFCQLLIKENLKIKYKISSRVDNLDDELLSYLKKSGCYRIHFGVESGCQEILNYFEKDIRIDQIRNAFKLAKKYNIDRFAYVMIGAPNETKDQIKMTTKLIKEIQPEHLHCSICTPMPKTHLYEKLLRNGTIKNDYWYNFAENPYYDFKTPFCSKLISGKNLRKMQEKIQKQFYFRPKIILQELLNIKSPRQLFLKVRLATKILLT